MFRQNKELLNVSLDMILIAKPGMPESNWQFVLQEYKKALNYINKHS